jgi:hypothetical protein
MSCAAGGVALRGGWEHGSSGLSVGLPRNGPLPCPDPAPDVSAATRAERPGKPGLPGHAVQRILRPVYLLGRLTPVGKFCRCALPHARTQRSSTLSARSTLSRRTGSQAQPRGPRGRVAPPAPAPARHVPGTRHASGGAAWRARHLDSCFWNRCSALSASASEPHGPSRHSARKAARWLSGLALPLLFDSRASNRCSARSGGGLASGGSSGRGGRPRLR